jgi:hypothetical protein
MSEEKNWARFYQEHKDDPDVWGEPEEDAPPARKGGLSATISVRFSPEEAAAIREVAQELDVPYSEIVRRAVRKFVQFRLTSGETSRFEPGERHDYSLSTAETSTGSLALSPG